MNGQTGKFIGDIPLDKKRVVAYIISIFVITFLICVLVSYILWKLGV